MNPAGRLNELIPMWLKEYKPPSRMGEGFATSDRFSTCHDRLRLHPARIRRFENPACFRGAKSISCAVPAIAERENRGAELATYRRRKSNLCEVGWVLGNGKSRTPSGRYAAPFVAFADGYAAATQPHSGARTRLRSGVSKRRIGFQPVIRRQIIILPASNDRLETCPTYSRWPN